MEQHDKLVVFEDKKIRRIWHNDEWYFSVVDVIGALTESADPRNYWKVLKNRLIEEGSSQTVTNCNQFKLVADDGKMRLTDVADTETLLRLVQSIPSPNAEPFKLWLAKVGYERLEETADPELSIMRALKAYLSKGYSLNWINQRLKSIEIRKELTDEWEKAGVKEGIEFAILTDEISKAWTGMTTREYKNLKGLKKDNLRDNMTNLELVLNMLAETATTEISKKEEPIGLGPSKKIAKRGGGIAGNARKQIESETRKPVITSENWKTRKDKLLK